MNLWIVGKVLSDDGLVWEFQGVFDNKEQAIASCNSKRYFIGPAILNKVIPDEGILWEGAYYPKADNAPAN